MQRRGAIEREAPSAVLLDQTSRLWSRSGLEHKNDVARGLAEQQAGGDALAVRDRGSLTWPARRRLQGGEAPTGLSAAGFRITTARSDLGFVETVTPQTLRTMSGAPRPFPSAHSQKREDEKPCLRKTPSVGFADSSPNGGASMPSSGGGPQGRGASLKILRKSFFAPQPFPPCSCHPEALA